MVMADLWPTLRGKRYPPAWDGIEPEGATVILWTPRSIRILCGECSKSLGSFRAYHARGEYGIVRDVPIRYHPTGRHTADALARMPNDRQQADAPIYWLTGEEGFRAAKTCAHFRCTICRIEFEGNCDASARSSSSRCPRRID
jgi:hypothetical protein